MTLLKTRDVSQRGGCTDCSNLMQLHTSPHNSHNSTHSCRQPLHSLTSFTPMQTASACTANDKQPLRNAAPSQRNSIQTLIVFSALPRVSSRFASVLLFTPQHQKQGRLSLCVSADLLSKRSCSHTSVSIALPCVTSRLVNSIEDIAFLYCRASASQHSIEAPRPLLSERSRISQAPRALSACRTSVTLAPAPGNRTGSHR
jgi:hypothetical protein